MPGLSKLVVVRYRSGELFTVVPNRLLCYPDTSPMSSTGHFAKHLVTFARHDFGDNYYYQDDNAPPDRPQVILDFPHQGNVTKMEQAATCKIACNPIEYYWEELSHAITSMDNPPENRGEVRQALLDKWPKIPVECLQCRVASMPWRLAAIITARGGNTRY